MIYWDMSMALYHVLLALLLLKRVLQPQTQLTPIGFVKTIFLMLLFHHLVQQFSHSLHQPQPPLRLGLHFTTPMLKHLEAE